MFEWQFSGKTDVGRVRELNEDCIYSDSNLGFVVLADGMGGHQGGEIASAMAVSGVTLALSEANFLNNSEPHSTLIPTLLDQTISKVNKEIFHAAESKAQYKGMGTTIVVAVKHENVLFYAHVGDSRLYRFRKNKLEQLTKDHSLVNELLEQGYYKTPEEAASAGQKNVITRAVGIAEEVKVDVAQVSVEEDDMFLLCSDGLSDMINDKEISNCLQNFNGEQDILLSTLINKACDAGGRDNVSVILLHAKKGSLLKKSLNWLFKS